MSLSLGLGLGSGLGLGLGSGLGSGLGLPCGVGLGGLGRLGGSIFGGRFGSLSTAIQTRNNAATNKGCLPLTAILVHFLLSPVGSMRFTGSLPTYA